MGPLVPDSFQNKRLIEVTESFLPNLPELKHHWDGVAQTHGSELGMILRIRKTTCRSMFPCRSDPCRNSHQTGVGS